MSDLGTEVGRDAASYEIEPKNNFFEATRAIVEYEIRPGNTVTFLAEVDLTEVERLRAPRRRGRKPSYTAFVVKAVALALRDFPYANRRVCRRAWLPFCDAAAPEIPSLRRRRRRRARHPRRRVDRVHRHRSRRRPTPSLSRSPRPCTPWPSATSTTNRAMARVQHHDHPAADLALDAADPPARASSPDSGSSIAAARSWSARRPSTGSTWWPATWSHPLGVSFGLVKPRPVVRDGAIVPCTTFLLTLNFDRRVMAGAQAARFFRRMVDALGAGRDRDETVPGISHRFPPVPALHRR